MSGSIEEIPLPDLLQLLSTSRKSGVLVLRSDGGVGKLYLRKGQIYFASIDDSFNMGPRKAIFRMLSWTQGFFELEPPDERAVLEELQDSTEGLLMEGMRQLDEHRMLSEKLPPLTARITIPRPLEPKLRDLGARGARRLPDRAQRRHAAHAVRRELAHRPHRRGEAQGPARQGLPDRE